MLPLVNWTAILVAGIVNMIIGYIWFSPSLFGKEWRKLAKVKPKKKGMGNIYLAALINSFVMAFGMSIFLGYAGVATISEAIVVAFWAWLGFMATIKFSGVLWAEKKFKLYLIDVANLLISFAVMAAIIVSI